MSIDQRVLRDAVARFPTGVAVITACDPKGGLLGVTVSSLTSVSLEPALLSFSLSRNLRSLDRFVGAENFAINVLREDQRSISTQFATQGGDKWNGVDWYEGPHGCPIISPNVATFECQKYASYEGGDHLIFLGRVLRLEIAEEGKPLVFYRSRYHGVCAPSEGYSTSSGIAGSAC
jgi:flavin reductase (DIM6/NTAB) family NADH-FMN oxidoreductase RutF